jgi:N-acyl-D-aspartate/D-glutamate deacylase
VRIPFTIFGFGILIATALAPAQDVDLVIRGGRIVDGTGNPSFLGDIAIRGNRIVALGHLASLPAKRVVEAKGLTVAPGFIDMHNHSDYTLIVDGNAQSMIRQGVTSMILGEGESAGPIGGRQSPEFRRVLPGGGDADWDDFR